MKLLQRRSKYHNKPTVVDGIRFHSKKEAKRYQQLRLLQLGKVITDLERQKPFKLVANGVEICKLVVDFYYIENGRVVCEDTKGFQTPESKLKMKLAAACFPGIDWRIT